MTHIDSYSTVTRFMVIAVAIAVASVPALVLGASFAYVNQAGEVNMITADNANIALATAPNIHPNSGVMLLDSADDQAVVGGSVQGI